MSTSTYYSQLETTIMEKAATDSGFRDQLVSNPKEAIKTHFNISMPAEMEVKIHEDTGHEMNLVLPPKLDQEHPGWT